MLKHLAIIMDGNRRWASSKKLSVYEGYKAGSQVVNKIISQVIEEKISYLTVYAFSFENWDRPIKEIAGIMNIAIDWFKNNLDFFQQNGIKCQIIGNKALIPYIFLNKIEEMEEATANNTKLNFQIALSYGSRDEILRAVLKATSSKDFQQNINEENFKDFLDTKDIPDPDLLIRTGGQKRLSNYMLWQLAYTELSFIDEMWPDFSEAKLKEIITNYKKTERKFGYL